MPFKNFQISINIHRTVPQQNNIKFILQIIHNLQNIKLTSFILYNIYLNYNRQCVFIIVKVNYR